MPHLSPTTLTAAEQRSLLVATAARPRGHTIFSLALSTGLRLGEIVGLNVGDVYHPDGTPRTRVHLRREIAKGGRAGDVFLPDALVEKLARFWLYKQARHERLDASSPLFCKPGATPHLTAPGAGALPGLANRRRVLAALSLPRLAPLCRAPDYAAETWKVLVWQAVNAAELHDDAA